MEDEVFTCLKRADVIETDMMLMDATVLPSFKLSHSVAGATRLQNRA